MNKHTFLIVVSDQQEGTIEAITTPEEFGQQIKDALRDQYIVVHEIHKVDLLLK